MSLAVSRDKGNSSCNPFWLNHWLRGPLRALTAIRTRSFDPYWLISSMVRRRNVSVYNAFADSLSDSLPFGLRNVGKWNQQGEHQPAVGVLLLTQGMDGEEGTGPYQLPFSQRRSQRTLRSSTLVRIHHTKHVRRVRVVPSPQTKSQTPCPVITDIVLY